jgi:xanthine dehydrogenase accessory factor
VYLEPVVPTTHLVVVGRSPMAHTLADFARRLGWRCDLREVADFSAADVGATSVVVIATQGHGDEEALEEAVSASPAFVGLVASRRRGETVLGYLADKGLAREQLDRVKVPVGLDLGRTSHREIAVSILAELVQLRASGALREDGAEDQHGVRQESASTALAVDPVCGMTVAADPSSRPVEHAGTTYYFCSAGCRAAFEKDPQTYITGVSAG